jgi:hypothetical protein
MHSAARVCFPDPEEIRAVSDIIRRYLLPGFVFEAAVIGGGDATVALVVLPALPVGVRTIRWLGTRAATQELADAVR